MQRVERPRVRQWGLSPGLLAPEAPIALPNTLKEVRGIMADDGRG